MRSALKMLLLRGLSRRIAARSSTPGTNPLLDLQVRVFLAPTARLSPSFLVWDSPANPSLRCFSSEPAAVENKDPDHGLLVEVFSRAGVPDEIKAGLESAGLSLDHQTVNSVLRSPETSPEVARRVFNWISEREDGILSSKSYNLMLGILGVEGNLKEFWDMVEVVKKKGYGVSKGTYFKVSDSFEKKGMDKDLDMLKEIYVSNSPENYVQRTCPRICKILREGDELRDDVWKELGGMGIRLSSDLVSIVLERLTLYPKKAFVFFRWVGDNSSFKIDGKTYNVMARVLGREDCIDEFWDVLNEMRNGRHVLERETYVKASERFYRRKMIKEAVDLYEFAMGCVEKPTLRDFSYLLRKVVTSDELDLGLISRVVRILTDVGYVVKETIFDGALKSLISVGKLGDCDKMLKAMEEGGFVANSSAHDRIVIGLCNAGKLDEACRFLVEMEGSGRNPDLKTWASLVQRLSLAGETEKALSCFCRMVERRGGKHAGCAFEALVNGFCKKGKAKDACKLLAEMVNKQQLLPWHSTYKFLIERLLSQGNLKEASGLLGLMKSHEFPPFIDPFIDYILKSGTGDDTIIFLKAMTVKSFPSISVFMHIFEGLLRAERHEMAHDLLSKSPGYIRDHADVLSLFFSMKSEEALTAESV